MARDRDEWANNLAESGGWMSGFLADEGSFDRRAKWRLGSWGVGALAAMVVAMLASQASISTRREYSASADLLARQSQQFQIAARETQNESRRLASAIDTLNSDRDRLYSRVSSVEKNLDSVTGSIARQSATALAAPPASAAIPQVVLPPAPPIAPVETMAVAEPPPLKTPPPVALAVPALPPVALARSTISSTSMANLPPTLPDPVASRPSDADIAAPDLTASVPGVEQQPAAMAEAPLIQVQRTEFGIDLGGANSIDGLRALWRGLTASNKALASLRPIIMVKERSNGLGLQLRLVAGPLGDAATAAKLCATVTTSDRGCETSVFDGQRLALKTDPPPPAVVPLSATPAAARTAPRKRPPPRVLLQQHTETEVKPEEPPKPQSSLTSFFSR